MESKNIYYRFIPDDGLADYIKITVKGFDDKGTPVESSGIVRILPDKDFARIISITPDSGLVDGVETEFTAIVEYNLVSYSNGKVTISFNYEELEIWYILQQEFVDKGRGTHEFKVSCKPKNWKNLGDFSVNVCIDEEPPEDNKRLHCHNKILTF